jgi:hypothetical protein
MTPTHLISLELRTCYVVSSVLYRDEFPQERNDAREIMATLPLSRLEDLARDIWCELVERFPEFNEEVST